MAIDVSDLAFSYGSHRAVDGVSFSVAPGEIVGLLGPNGAGKSTTIKMLTGQIPPDRGRIEILGKSMPADREAIQARMGVCFEEKNLYASMSATENLQFFGKLFGLADVDTNGLLGRVGLRDRSDDRVSTYSKGMRQRLMMARVLLNHPDVLFLDEPTDGLDPVSSRAIRSIIQEEADRGAAVVLTTHDMMEADILSDRVAFINEGKILADDTPENFKLAHGQRSVRIRSKNGDEVQEIVVDLNDAGASDRIRDAVMVTNLLTVHTEEATLEDVFVAYAGRGLA
ncbi:MAG: ABC transporter ATP-binding protein [Acidimicrobiales bacterium]|nr:ABC transporter ATP-binding protein [Acidimicrobiia bacterium]NNF53095.1 ABC transporter ATP-binding protein [Acidimicrobiales bacterium]